MYSGPIKIRNDYMSRKRVATIGFGFAADWIKTGAL